MMNETLLGKLETLFNEYGIRETEDAFHEMKKQLIWNNERKTVANLMTDLAELVGQLYNCNLEQLRTVKTKLMELASFLSEHNLGKVEVAPPKELNESFPVEENVWEELAPISKKVPHVSSRRR